LQEFGPMAITKAHYGGGPLMNRQHGFQSCSRGNIREDRRGHSRELSRRL
jgi:hypothetical protein